jgi:hypothetical protein
LVVDDEPEPVGAKGAAFKARVLLAGNGEKGWSFRAKGYRLVWLFAHVRASTVSVLLRRWFVSLILYGSARLIGGTTKGGLDFIASVYRTTAG